MDKSDTALPPETRWVIRTGIPSIDRMFHIQGRGDDGDAGLTSLRPSISGIGLADLRTATSLCIVGPQGTGKSVLAMHVAARYLADCHELARPPADSPRVCYVSTDMTHPVAAPMLQRFGLHRPNDRRLPFNDYEALTDATGALLHPCWLRQHVRSAAPTFDRDFGVGLVECPADEPTRLAEYVRDGAGDMAFVDLASRTAGDDWAFVHRLLGVLPPPGDGPRHLLVVDAVEGLETFGGEMDGFGENSPRRARIAKLMRLATGKCHLVVIVEEAEEDSRLPEEFVSDAVIRLRSLDDHGYLRRTLQIEKARGQSTARGRHAYVIRSGEGSTTGDAPNYDDPCVRGGRGTFQSYVELFPSLHYASRNIMAAATGRRAAPPPECAGFGIAHLDDMLAEEEEGAREGSDERGLPCSSITALIGDAGTQKSGLGVAFLGQAFAQLIAALLADLRDDRSLQRVRSPGKCQELLSRRYSQLAGISILITTHNDSRRSLTEYFLQKQLGDFPLTPAWREGLREFISGRIVCRRLELHDMPSAVLFNAIKRAIEAGQRIAFGGDPDPLAPEQLRLASESQARFTASWRIRFVIDDLSTIMDTYAHVKADLLFLPFLLHHLRREGLTSLIIDTRAGPPDTVTGEGFHTDLRALSDYRIYTWPVSEFYGDHRVAIAPIPPIARDRRARVREVKRLARTGSPRKGELFVDPVFELYAGLEENKPKLVPLEVRLYAETDACREYATYLNDLFRRVFRADPERRDNPADVVIGESVDHYNVLRDASYLKVDTRLDLSLVVQIDEFWPQGHSGELERKYLLEDVGTQQHKHQPEVKDPFHTYREKQLAHPPRVSGSKARYFAAPECDVSTPRESGVDRVPFTWDFGFIACREEAWAKAARLDESLGTFWSWYSRKRLPRDAKPREALTWRNFLGHSATVADGESRRTQRRVPAFDLAMLVPESFSCLMLEVWLSEIQFAMRQSGRVRHGADLSGTLGKRLWREDRTHGLLTLLKRNAKHDAIGEAEIPGFPGWSLELYRAWLLLVEALDLKALAAPGHRFDFASQRRFDPSAVSVRHWYKTACAVSPDDQDGTGPIHYGRLPGLFTTRGDWFLAVAPESRSFPLASRALDLLCSTRGNMRRLQRGIGLPTRRLVPRDARRGHESLASTFRTMLTVHRGPFGIVENLSYADLVMLGARPDDPAAAWEEDHGRFKWLWRSALNNYHRHATTWQSWLFRVAGDWWRLKESKGTDWKNGFEVYDAVNAATPRELTRRTGYLKSLESFDAFPESCRDLVDELALVDT